MSNLSENIEKIKSALNDADYVIIGAGAGLSTAAGIEYGGKRFTDNFQDYIDKYDMTDMYTSGFYPFESEEEKWGYWAKHVHMNNVGCEATELYKKLLKLVENRDYFVITTNVDDQFYKAGFPSAKVFATQGSYNYFQCSEACHDSLYKNTDEIIEMVENIDDDLKIPSELVPKCPKCGKPMDLNLRKDSFFVEDIYWHKQSEAYKNFINKAKNGKCVLLEFGIGYNTPAIIRFPFETYAAEIPDWTLVRFNKSHLELAVNYHNTLKLMTIDMFGEYKLPNNFLDRYIPISDDIETVVDELLK